MTELASKPTTPLAAQDGIEAVDRPAIPLSWLAVWASLILLAVVGTSLVSRLPRQVPSGEFVPIIALLVCLLAAGYDAASGRIPNQITYPAILIGLSINGLTSLLACLGHDPASWLVDANWLGDVGLGQAFAGFGVCAVTGIVCLMLAGMGGGDVKLLVALGALLGFSQVTHLMLWTLLLAVPYSLINLLIAGRLNGVMRTAALQMLQIVYLRQLDPIAPPSRTRIPLAVPVLGAMFAVRWMPLTRWIG